MRAGLLGERLGHSYSPQIHAFFGDYSYDLFEVTPEKLDSFMRGGGFDALNVTIPYKRAVMPLLRAVDGRGAGDRQREHHRSPRGRHAAGRQYGRGGLHGDAQAPERGPCGQKGAGAGQRRRFADGTLMCSPRSVRAKSSSFPEAVKTITRISTATRTRSSLVNATPVGMFPNCGVSPVDLKTLPKLSAVLDIIYNPARTQLLMDASKRWVFPASAG